jgi:hypothetical protein
MTYQKLLAIDPKSHKLCEAILLPDYFGPGSDGVCFGRVVKRENTPVVSGDTTALPDRLVAIGTTG